MTATIQDVARRAGVSVGTVSRWLNGYRLREYNRVKIEQAIEELEFRGNYLARSLRSRRTWTIGVVTPNLQDVFVNSIVTVFEREMSERGYNLLIADYADDPRAMRKKLLDLDNKMVDGIVFFPRNVGGDVDLGLSRLTAPLIVVDEDFPAISCDKVLADNVRGSYEATAYLAKRGHRDIAVVCGTKESAVGLERLKGFKLAMADHNLEVQDRLVVWGDFTIPGGYRAAKVLLGSNAPPTGLVVTNYYMTLGAIMAAYELNVRIPAFLSLIGFGNFELSEIARPPLTVIDQPIEAMGHAIAEILRDRIEKRESGPPIKKKLPPTLLERKSVRGI